MPVSSSTSGLPPTPVACAMWACSPPMGAWRPMPGCARRCRALFAAGDIRTDSAAQAITAAGDGATAALAAHRDLTDEDGRR